MPTRLIRDEILDSERVLSLPIEARWLYVTILLSADDLGLFEATAFKLSRRSDIRREAGEHLLGMLADADLVRLYEVGGKRYGFIPRFRQRIQIKFMKHPAPPEALMLDDEDALNKIRHLTRDPTVVQPVRNSDATAGQPPEAKAKAKEETNLQKEQSRLARATRLPKDMTKPPQEWLDFCRTERPDLDPKRTFESFRDYWIAKAGQAGCKLDWLATWRNWVRNQRHGRAQQPSGGLFHDLSTMNYGGVDDDGRF